MVSAKWSTLVSEIPKAQATGRLRLRTHATAVRLELGRDGRVSRVVYADGKGALHAQADATAYQLARSRARARSGSSAGASLMRPP